MPSTSTASCDGVIHYWLVTAHHLEKYDGRLVNGKDDPKSHRIYVTMYRIYANIWGKIKVNVTIYGIHGSYGIYEMEN
jgi:hypothetical protein